MADMINVPGLGPTKAVYVYAGGALAVGILAYAWWKNAQGSQQPADFVGASEDDFGVSDYDSPLGNTGSNGTGSDDVTDPEALTTNAKWTSFVVEKMSMWGYDVGAVSVALGKYLARQGLTETQVTYVQTAIAIGGPPPVGGPYPIINALPGGGGDPDPDPDDEPVYHQVAEGQHVQPTLNGLGISESKAASLNPGWPDKYVTWAKDKVGYVPAGTPGAIRVFGSAFQLRIR